MTGMFTTGRWWTLTGGRFQVKLTAALAVSTATWLRDEEARLAVADHQRLTTTASDTARSQRTHPGLQPQVSDGIRQAGPILQPGGHGCRAQIDVLASATTSPGPLRSRRADPDTPG